MDGILFEIPQLKLRAFEGEDVRVINGVEFEAHYLTFKIQHLKMIACSSEQEVQPALLFPALRGTFASLQHIHY